MKMSSTKDLSSQCQFAKKKIQLSHNNLVRHYS